MNGFISNYMGVPCLSTSSLFCLIHQWVSQWLLQDLPSSNWNKYLHDFSNTGREKIIHNDCSYLFFSWNCMIMAACVGETVNCIALSSNSNSNWFQSKPFQKERERERESYISQYLLSPIIQTKHLVSTQQKLPWQCQDFSSRVVYEGSWSHDIDWHNLTAACQQVQVTPEAHPEIHPPMEAITIVYYTLHIMGKEAEHVTTWIGGQKFVESIV